MSWKKVKLGELITESRIPASNPSPERRIRVKLNMLGVEKRPIENEIEGATKQFERKAGQFIYGKQNFHKGAFGIVPKELDGFDTSADIPSFDIREDCLAEWIFYFFKIGNRYLELEKLARGVGSKRIHPNQIADIEIPLPPISIQKQFIEKFKKLESQNSQLATEFTHQLDLIKQLRQTILREAMQGKLVKTEIKAGEETGHQLLERIKAKKQKLIKEGKLKKDKPLSPIKPEEIPFEIPENWVWCRLNDICEVIVDCPHSTPKYLDIETDYFGIDTNCINEQGKIIRLRSLSKESYLERVKRIVPQKDDLIYSREGSIGLAALLPENKNICLGQRVMLFRASKVLDVKFLKYIVTNEEYKNRLIDKHRGMGAKHVNVSDIIKSLVPLPPSKIQQQIVSKLEATIRVLNEIEFQIVGNQVRSEMLMQVSLKEALEAKEKAVEEQLSIAAESEVQYGKAELKNLFFRRVVLASEITYQLHKEPTFGHLKLQKLVFLCEWAGKMDLFDRYEKQAAGPYDRTFMHSIDSEFKRLRWFSVVKEDSGKHTYSPLEKVEDYKRYYNNYFSTVDKDIQRIIDIFRTAKSDKVELIATLFSCWKELIKEKAIITDEIISQRFYSWSKEKGKFSKERVFNAIAWMKETGIKP